MTPLELVTRPTKMRLVESAVLERFAGQFVFEPDGCWRWTGALYENGYGAFWLNGRNVRAHRFAYELLVGPIPEGLDLDHLCRNRPCVNPTHLEPVTRQTNLRRAPRFNSHMRTHCVHGHELTPENTRRERNGYPRCRACDRECTCRSRARRRVVLSPDLEAFCALSSS